MGGRWRRPWTLNISELSGDLESLSVYQGLLARACIPCLLCCSKEERAAEEAEEARRVVERELATVRADLER